MRSRVLLVVLVMVGAGLVAPAAGAAPPDLVCGQVITTDVVLRTDLTCDGDGLIIAASGVTVKLGNHTITSTNGTGMGIQLGEEGPEESTCVHELDIRGGTISGFFAGIKLADGCSFSFPTPTRPAYLGDAGRVSGSTLTNNTWGIYMRSYRLAVDRTTIVGTNGIGGHPSGPTGSVHVTNSRIQVTSPDGFNVFGWALSERVSVDSSRLTGGRIHSRSSGVAITNSGLTDVTIDCDDAGVILSNSRVTGGGIEGGQACDFGVTGNRFVGPGSGTAVVVQASPFRTAIEDNVFTGWDMGIRLSYGETTIAGNTFRGNRLGIACETAGCRGTVSGNRFVGNSGTGLLLHAGTWHVGSNTALRNGGLGIDAVGPGLVVIDDGGNVARRNLPPQCIGVVCTAHP